MQALTEFGHNIVAVVISLGFLIFVHEAGHFLMAKLFGVRVLVFSFGFGKRLFGFRRGETDYRVSLVPLGGYVRMSGDNPEEAADGDPRDFLAKPKWQRFLILFAGPFMNLVIALAFMTIVNMAGRYVAIIPPIVGDVLPNQPAAGAGLQHGDRITAVNGDRIEDFDDLRMTISMSAGTRLKIDYVRDGQPRSTTLIPRREQTTYGTIGRAGFGPLINAEVGKVEPGTIAAKAGLNAGDRIIGVDGAPVTQVDDFNKVVIAKKGAAMQLVVQRGAQQLPMTLAAAPFSENDPYRGFAMATPVEFRKLPLGSAIVESARENMKMVRYAFAAIGRLFRPEGSVKELSGVVTIAKISGEAMKLGWKDFIHLIAMISLQLGIMNLLPIPVLDGGHIMVLLVEGAARRDLSIRVKERIQQVGFAALATLMILVTYNDIILQVFHRRS
jgi:regulator of sigma E protease